MITTLFSMSLTKLTIALTLSAPGLPAIVMPANMAILGCPCDNPVPPQCQNDGPLKDCCTESAEERARPEFFNQRFNSAPDDSAPDFSEQAQHPDFPMFRKTKLSLETVALDPNDEVYFNITQTGGNAVVRRTGSETLLGGPARKHSATLWESGPSTGPATKIKPALDPPPTPGVDPKPTPGVNCGVNPTEQPGECPASSPSGAPGAGPPGINGPGPNPTGGFPASPRHVGPGSIKLHINLGTARDEGDLGTLKFDIDRWPDSSSGPAPHHLQCHTDHPDVEKIWWTEPRHNFKSYVLRQVITPSAFIDIALSEWDDGPNLRYFTIRFYDPNDIAAATTQEDPNNPNPDPNDPIPPHSLTVYQPKAGSVPFAQWKLTKNNGQKYFIAELQTGAGVTEEEYRWDWEGSDSGGKNEYSFTRSGPGTAEIDAENVWETDPNNSPHKFTNWYQGSTLVQQTKETHATYGGARLITRSIADPGGLNRATVYGYNTKLLLASILTPEGNDTYFEYESNGRIKKKIESWASHTPTSAAGPGRIVEYGYGSDPNDWNPTSIKVTINDGSSSTVVEYTGFDYETDPNGTTLREKQYLDPVAQTTYLETTTKYDNQNRVKLIVDRSGLTTEYQYEDDGFYNPSGTGDRFTPFVPSEPNDPNPAVPGRFQKRTITYGRIGQVAGVPFKSTIAEQIINPAGKLVFQRTLVVTDPAPAEIGWERHVLDGRGRVIKTIRSNNTEQTRTYDTCCAADSVTDETGRKTETTHDDLGRPVTVTQFGAPAFGGRAAEPDIASTYEYTVLTGYTAGGAIPAQTVTRVKMTRSATGETDIVTRDWFDVQDRLVARQVDGLLTTYAQLPLKITETRPNGATVIKERHPDGRLKSVTGTGTVHATYTYGITNGDRWTKIVRGPTGSNERFEATYVDALGRVSRTERPGFGASMLRTFYAYYDDTSVDDAGSFGRLHVMDPNDGSDSTINATAFEYDELGRLLRTGIDGDSDGVLQIGCVGCNGGNDIVSADRIEETRIEYIQDGSDWFRQTKTTQFRKKGATVVPRITKERLTGFSTGQISETIEEDIYGNETTTSREIDSATSMVVTETTTFTATTATTEQVYRNGRPIKSTDRAGLITEIEYDGFGRTEVTIDSRQNATTTAYEPGKSRIASRTDAANSATTYTYNSDGELSVVTNDLGGTTRYDYDLLGQVTHIWGSVPQPVRMAYDDYGQRTDLFTYRETPGGSSGWDSTTWPGTGLTEDQTTWVYDDETGLLTEKKYAEVDSVRKGTTYSYRPDGRLQVRTWARLVGSNALETTYTYDADYGDLTSIDYSDSTPDVTMTYLLTGELSTVEDAAGKRTIAYDGFKRPKWETYADSSAYSALYGVNTRLSTSYLDEVSYFKDLGGGMSVLTSTNFDRLTRIAFGTTTDDDATYEALYTYNADDTRMDTVEGPGLHNDGVRYAYDDPATANDPGSNMLVSIEYIKNGAVKAKREFEYETTRNLLKHTAMIWDPTGSPVTKSKYEYGYDDLDRRTHVTYSGTAFSQTEHDRWDYNARSELTESRRYIGAHSAGTGTPGDPNLSRDYEYDPIGNRLSRTEGADELFYCTNALNQYEEAGDEDCDPAEETFVHDEDGNLIEDGQFKYTWDAENRLVAVEMKSPSTSDDKKLTFGYDYRNRRVWKKVFDWDPTASPEPTWEEDPSVHRKFIWYNWLMITELDGSDDSVVRRYSWGLDLAGHVGGVGSIESAGGIGGLLAVEDEKFDTSTKRYLACYDGNGNLAQLLLRSDGSLQARYQFDVYGNVVAAQDTYSDENPMRFSTKYFDGFANIGYWGERYFATHSGRWLSRDPIHEKRPIVAQTSANTYEERGGTYTYVSNKPSSAIDPTGLTYFEPPFSVGGGLPGPGWQDACKRTRCDNFLREELGDLDWLKGLPNCPCSLAGANNGVIWDPPTPVPPGDKYHPGAANCVRSKPHPREGINSGQQCCYDGTGALITGGPAAGTPDKVSPNYSVVGHFFADVEIFDDCPVSDYLKARPPNNGNNCAVNVK